MSSYGLSVFGCIFALLMFWTVSIPLTTRPNTVCLLSSHGYKGQEDIVGNTPSGNTMVICPYIYCVCVCVCVCMCVCVCTDTVFPQIWNLSIYFFLAAEKHGIYMRNWGLYKQLNLSSYNLADNLLAFDLRKYCIHLHNLQLVQLWWKTGSH